jgi:hypothetical protein
VITVLTPALAGYAFKRIKSALVSRFSGLLKDLPVVLLGFSQTNQNRED